jgi:hypothetical protein
MSEIFYTSTFYLDRNSPEDARSQWVRHLQARAYIKTIDGIVARNRDELAQTIRHASAQHKEVLQSVCGSVEEGFARVTAHLQLINCNISQLRGEISAMAAMLDWKMSELIEEQRLTNELLGNIAELLRIPDSQKQRVYYIEQGLKYLKNAILEGGVNSGFYDDALEAFKCAEGIERKDYITLGRLGHIYLYSTRHMNIPLAEQYFLKAAREALAEDNVSGTSTAVHLGRRGHKVSVYAGHPFKAAAAEAYLYAGRTCYLQNKLSEATQFAARAYELIPEFTKAGFEQAKYLSAADQQDAASCVLAGVIEKDRYFAIKTLADPDLGPRTAVLRMLTELQTRTQSRAEREYQHCAAIVRYGSEAAAILARAKQQIARRNLLDGLGALDLLEASYQLPYSEYSRSNEVVKRWQVRPSLSLRAFLEKENGTHATLEKLRREAQIAININRGLGFGIAGGAIGFVVGFFRGCSVQTFSVDGRMWFGTLLVGAIAGALLGLIVATATIPKVEDTQY